MSKQPTAAQRRAVAAADPATGLLRASPAVLEALAGLGLAVRHPRPPHRFYLTPAGRSLRAGLTVAPAPGPAPAVPAAEAGVFAARTGHESAPCAAGHARAHDVLTAWQGLLEQRRVLGHSAELPCTWERAHLVPAAAIALEAAGCRPALADAQGRCTADGFQVSATGQPEAVQVIWATAAVPPQPPQQPPAGLESCRAALESAGWQVSHHCDRHRTGLFLLASPRRA
jgi:hypothetical protein